MKLRALLTIIDTSTHWPTRFEAWRAYAERVGARAKAIKQAKDDRAYALAATVGLPRHATCIHNAAIDEGMTGWCKDHPERLKVAKRVVHLLNDWRASRLADAVIQRHYPR